MNRQIILILKNISVNIRENQNPYILLNIFYDNLAVYEIMWKNIAELDRPH
jgi:hypothetical protein